MEKLGYYLVTACLKAIALLPLSVLYAVSDGLRLLVRHVFKYKRRRVAENLRNAFPEKTNDELEKIEKGFYKHLCDCIVETVKMLHISDKEMRRRVDVTNAHLIEQAADEHRPVFLFIGHLGNWEWVQEVTKRISRPTVHGELYRPLASKVFGRVFQKIRSRYPTLLITQKEAARTIIRLKQEHESFLIGFIADQRPTRNSLHHWTTFLNQDTPYMAGGEQIGRHVDAKYLYLEIHKPRRGHYVMNVVDLVLTEEAAAKQGKDQFPYVELYLKKLERNICEAPEIYLWSHNRWKHKRNHQ